MNRKARLIAFYLPQFHPISENDEWWGKGFTEWTNVTKARPLFRGHIQPVFPADLGYYDLRVPEIRQQQAELARQAKIEGFCYWHYWFGNEKKILEKPLQDVLASKKPAYPFCMCWANETWSGIWYGDEKRILIEQTYPGIADFTAHFNYVLPFLRDERYIKVDDKPLFLVYNPKNIPNPMEFADCWKGLAQKNGLKGLHLVSFDENFDYKKYNFDGMAPNLPGAILNKIKPLNANIGYRLLKKFNILKRPRIFRYTDYVNSQSTDRLELNNYPTILPNWDNTPRSNIRGVVFHNSSPGLFEKLLKKSIAQVQHKPFQHRLVFIKAWNEWAEGNYLEPDTKFGHQYLDVLKQNI